MSKRLRSLKFLNRQVTAVVNGHHSANLTTEDALLLLCSVSPCSGWVCEECPVRRETDKIEKEKKNVKP